MGVPDKILKKRLQKSIDMKKKEREKRIKKPDSKKRPATDEEPKTKKNVDEVASKSDAAEDGPSTSSGEASKGVCIISLLFQSVLGGTYCLFSFFK